MTMTSPFLRLRLNLAGTLVAASLAGACASQQVADPSGAGGFIGSGGNSGGTLGTGGGSGGADVGAGGTNAGSGGSTGSGGTPPASSGGTTGSGGASGAGPASGGTAGGGAAGAMGSAGHTSGLPDPGATGDGDSMIGPSYSTQPDLTNKGNPRGKSVSFALTSMIYDGKDSTITQTPINVTRTIQVYVPAMYKDGTPAPVLVIQDGPGDLSLISYALDNLTVSTDPTRKIPPFIAIAIPNGGADSIGSERGLEYDTMSDRYARYVSQEVLPAVVTHLKPMYPNVKLDPTPSGRATEGCSSGAAAAFTMGWFRPDLFSRVIAYSATLVAQQDPRAPEAKTYPHGAWDYHSDLELIKNDTMGREKLLRIFHNANENDNGSTADASGRHNWLMAGTRTAAALKAKGFHYKFVEGMGAGHCASQVRSASLADALIWVWRGYQPPAM